MLGVPTHVLGLLGLATCALIFGRAVGFKQVGSHVHAFVQDVADLDLLCIGETVDQEMPWGGFVAVDGKIPFVTIGYGGVSAMNSRGISLGKMGGRGEGQWDGVPVATRMRRATCDVRRATEECSMLAQVKTM
jgi:hypothetical protein